MPTYPPHAPALEYNARFGSSDVSRYLVRGMRDSSKYRDGRSPAIGEHDFGGRKIDPLGRTQLLQERISKTVFAYGLKISRFPQLSSGLNGK